MLFFHVFSYVFCAFIWESELFFVFLFSFFPAGTSWSGGDLRWHTSHIQVMGPFPFSLSGDFIS